MNFFYLYKILDFYYQQFYIVYYCSLSFMIYEIEKVHFIKHSLYHALHKIHSLLFTILKSILLLEEIGQMPLVFHFLSISSTYRIYLKSILSLTIYYIILLIIYYVESTSNWQTSAIFEICKSFFIVYP
jgi:hypothetical protein